jgi:predicted nucleic acid-binding protein
MKLVLDADVLVAGLRSSSGASRVLLSAVDAGMIIPLVSVAEVLEYEAVLKRPQQMEATRLSRWEIDCFLDDYIAQIDHIKVAFRTRPLVKDPDDEIFAELAINSRADALVTFNLTDYRPADPQASVLDIPVCRPGDILRRLTWRPPATSRFGSLPH